MQFPVCCLLLAWGLRCELLACCSNHHGILSPHFPMCEHPAMWVIYLRSRERQKVLDARERKRLDTNRSSCDPGLSLYCWSAEPPSRSINKRFFCQCPGSGVFLSQQKRLVLWRFAYGFCFSFIVRYFFSLKMFVYPKVVMILFMFSFGGFVVFAFLRGLWSILNKFWLCHEMMGFLHAFQMKVCSHLVML